jgi:hypothetical protein
MVNKSISRFPEYGKMYFFSAVFMFVCFSVYVYVFALLAPELLDIFYSCSIFKSLAAIISWCPVDMNVLAKGIEARQVGLRNKL